MRTKVTKCWCFTLRAETNSSAKLNGKDIIVKSEERNAEGIRFITTETYNMVGGDCKLVRESKTVVHSD